MTAKFRKSKTSVSVPTGPGTAPDRSASGVGGLAPPSPGSGQTVESTLKSDILPSIKIDISVIIRMGMKAALTEDFNFIKSELQAVRAEVVNSTTALRA